MPRGKKVTEAQVKNSLATQFYIERFEEIAINRFEWKNMPKTVDVRFFELYLFTQGMVVFFKDDVMDYLCLPTKVGTPLNVYNIPTERTAYASNGYNNNLTDKNSVLIFNNYLHSPSLLGVTQYATRIALIDRIIDVNVNAQRTPFLISCKENQKLTLKNMLKQLEDNEQAIFGYKDIDPNTLQVFPTQAPYIADKLNQLKKEIYNECLTYLGISNVNEQKKERLLTDEVERNQGGINAEKFTVLNARREAAQQINDMFGLNITVNFRTTPNDDKDGDGDYDNVDENIEEVEE